MPNTLSFIFKWSTREQALSQMGPTYRKTKEKFSGYPGHSLSGDRQDKTVAKLSFLTDKNYSDKDIIKGLGELFPGRKVQKSGDDFRIEFV